MSDVYRRIENSKKATIEPLMGLLLAVDLTGHEL